MFQFEQFPVYIKAEQAYKNIVDQILTQKFDLNLKNQLKRASSSIILNIAEGAGKYSKQDKKNFYTIARGSTHECVAILRILLLESVISEAMLTKMHQDFSEISKMLSGLINVMVR